MISHLSIFTSVRATARDSAAEATSGHAAGIQHGDGPTPATHLGRHPLPWLWLALVAGLTIVTASFRISVARPTAQTPFHVFWLGTLLAIVPAVLVCVAPATQRRVRLQALLIVGVVLSAPAILLRLNGPVYHDEFPHLREVQAILDTGHLFQPVSTVPIASSFPGLHSLSASLALVSGSGAWAAGIVAVLTAHLLTLLGVYVLSERLSGSERVGAIAAIIYGLNPSYMFFDTQFSYESLGVCLFVWAVVLAVAIGPDNAWRQATIATIVAAACVTTHHLTTLALLALLILLAVTRTVAWATGGSARVALATGALVAITIGLDALWILVVAPRTISYLTPYPRAAVQQLVNIATTSGSSRSLYAGTTVPIYEQVMAWATPLLVAMAAAGSWWHARTRKTLTASTLALYAFGMAYFLSVPLVLTASGAEGARRSWAFSYLGLAVLIAPWLARTLDHPMARRGRLLTATAFASALVVVLVGNVSAGLNAAYRFPGPVTYGVETRSTTAETLALANWLLRTQGPGAMVVTDRITGLALTSPGAAHLAIASADFPIYQLYTSPGQPPRKLIGQLRSAGYQYLVIDKRLAMVATQVPYFSGSEPDWPSRPPFTTAELSKFDGWGWTPKVYESTHYAVYRFDFSQLPTVSKTGSSITDATPGATP